MAGINPDDEKRFREINENGKAAESDPSKVLAERTEAQLAARRALVIQALEELINLDGIELSSDEKTELERAADVALSYLYEAGAPDYNIQDIVRHLKNYFAWQKRHEEGSPQKSWQPETDEELAVVAELVALASRLGDQDVEVAFKPALPEAGGRRHEVMDSQDTEYNKFGFPITHGMKQAAAAKRVNESYESTE